jgi:hypothetical protein
MPTRYTITPRVTTVAGANVIPDDVVREPGQTYPLRVIENSVCSDMVISEIRVNQWGYGRQPEVYMAFHRDNANNNWVSVRMDTDTARELAHRIMDAARDAESQTR